MLFRALPVFFAVLAAFALFASSEARPARGTILSKRLTAEERAWTNAKRLASGLPPRSPNFNRRRGTGTPVRRGGASPSPSPSPSPSHSSVQTFDGRIAIKSSISSPIIGYVNNSAGGLSVDVKGASGTDLRVELTTQLMSKVPVSVSATNADFKPVFVGGASDDVLAAHSPTVVALSNVPQTLAFEKPTSEGASAIWTLDSRTHQLKPYWVNTDGSVPDVAIGYNAKKNQLFLTGDLAVYNAASSSSAIAVEFYLVN